MASFMVKYRCLFCRKQKVEEVGWPNSRKLKWAVCKECAVARFNKLCQTSGSTGSALGRRFTDLLLGFLGEGRRRTPAYRPKT